MKILLILLTLCLTLQAGESLKELKKMAKANGWTFEVGDTGVNDVPIEELTGLIEPKDWKKTAKFIPLKATRAALPENYDVRDILGDHMPAIHKQTCGSCWAESTVGVFEIAIALHEVRNGKTGKFTEDLSVQELVDTCCSFGSCRGGWVASKYHVDKGATYEKEYPYVGRNQRCKKQRFVYKLENWGWLGSENRKPKVEEIKQAIFQYGAVTATVAAGGMSSYKSGIFNRCGAWSINHLVVLIGWKTIDGKNIWIMKNSWGTKWGIDGYMLMPTGCARIANSASYVVYKPAPPSKCGNKILEPGEQCDDGNLVSGDGCDENCQIEGTPAICGNGVVEKGEQCDDGNLVSGDGCDEKCQKESQDGWFIRALKWLWNVIISIFT